MQIAIDVGGTFTDFVVIDGDSVDHFKIPSVPEAPWKAVQQGIRGLGPLGAVFHGTTIGTNAFLEGKGAETVFITNKGFEDLLSIGRQTRPKLYDLHVRNKKPPVHTCFGIKGRLDAEGGEIEPLNTEEIEDIARELSEERLSAAVCLLHSYAGGIHENAVGDILSRYGVPYSLSSRISPEYREYERGLTTFMDAYLTPIMKRYFRKLEDILNADPYIIKSSGTLERPSTISPVDTLLSGPAGGTAGAVHISRLTGVNNLITLDIGGTSADMSTIIDGNLSWKDQGDIDGFPILSKMVDIVTVGSGGGSIARIDEGGMLRVGPESAGAYPGPVCYGRGGTEPAATDAHLLMGHIDPSYFLDGKMPLDIKGAKAAIKELSEKTYLTVDETLLGIFRISIAKMARCIKSITVGRGLDPEEFTLLAFGGAGPLYAATLADSLGISKVMIPIMPGVFSAFGMITSDITYSSSRTLLTRLSDTENIREVIDELLHGLPMKGGHRVYLGLRYKGQSHHLNILHSDDTEEMFHMEHQKTYGYHLKDADIEVVRVEVEVYRRRDVDSMPYIHQETTHPSHRNCLFDEGWLKTDIYYRSGLSPGKCGTGPAMIEDTGSTVLIPSSWSFSVDENGMIHMEVDTDE